MKELRNAFTQSRLRRTGNLRAIEDVVPGNSSVFARAKNDPENFLVGLERGGHEPKLGQEPGKLKMDTFKATLENLLGGKNYQKKLEELDGGLEP